MKKLYPVYTLKNQCQDCYKCVRECPVKSIRVNNGNASVINAKCIACGKCVNVCPAGAKKVRDDLDIVLDLFHSGKKVYVSLAPSWFGVYDYTPAYMIAMLKKLGFYAVSETALGAEQVSIKTANFLKEQSSGLYISSACPVIVDYVRLYKPQFANCIVPFASPALTHAKMLKEIYGNDIAVVFIGPCIAKKNESDSNKPYLDASLTFEELNRWVAESYINFAEITVTNEDKFVPDRSYEGSIYPCEGGMNETIKQNSISTADVTFLSCSGLNAFVGAVDGLNAQNMQGKIFLEALACDGGCVKGPCIDSKKPSVLVSSRIFNNAVYREKIPHDVTTVFDKEYTPVLCKEDAVDFADLQKALKKIGKETPEDELNCGGCGYSTCREMAAAIVRGDAEQMMCVVHNKRLAVKKAAAILRCMPSAIVMVDKNLQIVDANDSFVKMFYPKVYENFIGNTDRLCGACLDRLVSFYTMFSTALESGGDIHRSHYPSDGKLYDINIFTIEPFESVGAVITDVTEIELDRKKIALKAQEVINRNISKVQEIACLLGEHMVETETLLNLIARDYSKEGNKK